MDYAKIASQVIEHVGGKQNIKSVSIVQQDFVYS